MTYTPLHFEYYEFDSPDKPGSGTNMNPQLLMALDYIRTQLEVPLVVNSGFRTEEHNAKVGGKKHSQHLLGNAADIRITSQAMGDMIEYWFIDEVGQDCGIGRYNTFIHLDVRKYKARWDKRS